jgi:hypothetical protein
MNKKVMFFKITFIFWLLYFVWGHIVVRAFGNPVHDNIADFWNNIYNVDEKRMIAEIPNSEIKLYYIKEDVEFGMYRGFILQINGGKRFYSWENVNNPSYAPQLTISDLDKDGRKELIIQLCKGYGTGIFEGEVHVIRLDSFEETLVENPCIAIYKEKITLREFPEHFEIILKDKRFEVYKKEILTPPYSKVGIGWRCEKEYEVKDNILYAKVPVATRMSNIGQLFVKYKYKDKIFQVESIDFLYLKNQ